MEPAPSIARIARRSVRVTSDLDAAFTDAVLPELPRLRRTARLLVGTSDLADELVSEALARTLPRWRTGNVAEPVGYVRSTMVHLATRRWRRRAVGRRLDHRALDWLPSPSSVDHEIADRDAVLHAIARLAPRRRAIVVLRFYEDRSLEDIATVMGCAVGTVKSQLSRALGQLAAELEGPGE